MINLEKLKEKLEEFQKSYKEDNSPPWERLDEIYGNPLIRAFYDGYEAGWCGFKKKNYTCKYKEQYQEFHDWGHWLGWCDREFEMRWDMGEYES